MYRIEMVFLCSNEERRNLILTHFLAVVNCFAYITMHVQRVPLPEDGPADTYRLEIELTWHRSQAHRDFATAQIFQGMADYHYANLFSLFDDFDAGFRKLEDVVAP